MRNSNGSGNNATVNDITTQQRRIKLMNVVQMKQVRTPAQVAGSLKSSKTPPKGNNLRQCRKDAGLSPMKASRVLGVSIETLKRWELGYQTPHRNNLHQLASVYRYDRPVYVEAKVRPDYVLATPKYVGTKVVRRQVMMNDPTHKVRIVREWYV